MAATIITFCQIILRSINISRERDHFTPITLRYEQPGTVVPTALTEIPLIGFQKPAIFNKKYPDFQILLSIFKVLLLLLLF